MASFIPPLHPAYTAGSHYLSFSLSLAPTTKPNLGQRTSRRCTLIRMRASPSPAAPISSTSLDDSSQLVHEMLDMLSRNVFLAENPEDAIPGISEFLDDKVSWINPVFSCDTAKEATQELKKLVSFFLDPRLQFSEIRSPTSNVVTFCWTWSGTWPVPWGPRVVVSGNSKVKVERGKVTTILDYWNITPQALLSQIVPRYSDFMTFFGTPHAEITTLNWKTISEKSGEYRICEEPAGEMFKATQPKTEVKDSWFAVPTAPANAFSGAVKRAENYQTIIPIVVGKSSKDGNYTWSLAVPTKLRGGLILPYTNDSVDIVQNGRRKIAVSPLFGGRSTSERTKEVALKFIQALRRDGYLSSPMFQQYKTDEDLIRSDRVRLALYTAKGGFNSRGEFSVLSFIAHIAVKRKHEVWVYLDDDMQETVYPKTQQRNQQQQQQLLSELQNQPMIAEEDEKLMDELME